MFEAITIRPTIETNKTLDIKEVIDVMIYYGTVNVLGGQKELELLLKYFGSDLLVLLLKDGFLNFNFQLSHVSTMGTTIDKEKLFSPQVVLRHGETPTGVAYSAYRELDRNSSKANLFADRLLTYTEVYKYPKGIENSLIDSFRQKELTQNKVETYYVDLLDKPALPDEIEFRFVEETEMHSIPLYRVETNIDIKVLDEQFQKKTGGIYPTLDHSGFINSSFESKGDLLIASHYNSELKTRDLYSKLIATELSSLIAKSKNAADNIDAFEKEILIDCFSFGEAYLNGAITNRELYEILKKSTKFKSWLESIGEDKRLIKAYIDEITSPVLKQSNFWKNSKYVIFTGIGIIAAGLAPDAGISATVALNTIDAFLFDKIFEDEWKPNMFVDEYLIPNLNHK